VKLFLHLLRTDVRRLRLLLVAWIVVVAATSVLDGLQPKLASMRAQETLGIIRSLLGLAKVLLMFLIVPVTIQLHPLVGSDAFWMTRPIAPRVLLAVKTGILWVVLILIAAIAHAILMAAYSVPPVTALFVAVEGMLGQTLWLALLMIAAALTPNLSRFALLCGSAVLAAATFISASLAIFMATASDHDSGGSGDGLPDGTGWLVFTVLTIAAAGLLLWVQYRSRSRVHAIGAGLSGFAVAWLVASIWPWPLFALRFELPPWANDPATVRLSAEPGSVEVTPEIPSFTSARVWRYITAVVDVESVPAHWSAQPSMSEASVLVGGQAVMRTPVRRNALTASISAGGSELMRPIAMQLLGVQALAGVTRTSENRVQLISVPDDEFVRAASMIGRYEGRFAVGLTRHDIEAVLPLTSGSVHRNGAYRVAIEGMTRSSSTIALFSCESRAFSTFEQRPNPYSEYHFYLRNRRTSEGVAGERQPYFSSGLLNMLPMSGFSVGYGYAWGPGFTAQPYLVRFPARRGSDTDPTPPLTAAWLAGAELVIVRSTWNGSVERPLAIEPFKLEVSGPSGSASLAR
jgi:hypothetical protein